MSTLTNPAAALAAHAPKEVATQLESLIVKQMLMSSGAFAGSGATGSSLTSELFAETLADAVAHSGQLGLASSLGGQAAHSPAALPSPLPAPAALGPLPVADPRARVSSGFGLRTDPLNGQQRQHSGVDVAARAGSPILAADAGVVVAAGNRGGYGNAVEIQHPSGLSTLYAHAATLLVHPGDHVTQGQAIATVGQTGRATGPHLHFEVREGGHALNPTRALSAYRGRAEAIGRTPDE